MTVLMSCNNRMFNNETGNKITKLKKNKASMTTSHNLMEQKKIQRKQLQMKFYLCMYKVLRKENIIKTTFEFVYMYDIKIWYQIQLRIFLICSFCNVIWWNVIILPRPMMKCNSVIVCNTSLNFKHYFIESAGFCIVM